MGAKVDLDLARSFFQPLSRGEKLTNKLLNQKPDLWPVDVPEKGDWLDVFEISKMWVVNDKIKDIIEDLEPKSHRFIPFKIQAIEDDGSCGQYYLLHTRQTIESVVIEETLFAEGFGRQGYEKSPIISNLGNEITLRQSLISSQHFWRGSLGKLGTSSPFCFDYFCSDALKQRLDEAGVTGWSYQTCRVI